MRTISKVKNNYSVPIKLLNNISEYEQTDITFNQKYE